MVWEWNYWTISAVVILSTGLLYSLRLWRKYCVGKDREKIMSNLAVREAIQDAILAFHDKFREWPTLKSQIAKHLKVSQEQLDWVKTWDIKLVKVTHDHTAAHYSIMVTGTWLDWRSSPVRFKEEVRT